MSTHIEPLFPLIGQPLPLISALLTCIGQLLPLINALLTCIGQLLPLISALLARIGQLLPLAGVTSHQSGSPAFGDCPGLPVVPRMHCDATGLGAGPLDRLLPALASG